MKFFILNLKLTESHCSNYDFWKVVSRENFSCKIFWNRLFTNIFPRKNFEISPSQNYSFNFHDGAPYPIETSQ